MKIIFMGTPYFAAKALGHLIDSHKVVCAVTKPDRPRGRGQKMSSSFVKEVALANSIPVLQPESMKDEEFLSALAAYEADLFIVVAFGKFLNERILNMPKHGCINIHASLLPKYRGAAPINYAIINGETETGVTTMYMSKELDAGDIIIQKKIDISDSDNAGTLFEKLSDVGCAALDETLALIKSGNVPRTKQNDSESTYAPLLTKEIERIDWTKSTRDIINLIRGLNPTPVAHTMIDGNHIKVWQAFDFNTNSEGQPAEIVDIIKDRGIVVKTVDGALILTEIQSRGGNRMLASDYLRGNKVEIGTILN